MKYGNGWPLKRYLTNIFLNSTVLCRDLENLTFMNHSFIASDTETYSNLWKQGVWISRLQNRQDISTRRWKKSLNGYDNLAKRFNCDDSIIEFLLAQTNKSHHKDYALKYSYNLTTICYPLQFFVAILQICEWLKSAK